MARATGTRRKAYWDATKVTIAGTNGIGANAAPNAAQLKTGVEALCVAANNIGAITQMPSFGAPAAQVFSEEYGEAQAIGVPSQSTPELKTLRFTLNELDPDSNHHVALQDLGNGDPIAVVMVFYHAFGTGANRGHINATNVKYTARLIDGLVSGDGLVPGGTVNEISSYELSFTEVNTAIVRSL